MNRIRKKAFIFCLSWGGEEYAFIGSAEWVEVSIISIISIISILFLIYLFSRNSIKNCHQMQFYM